MPRHRLQLIAVAIVAALSLTAAGCSVSELAGVPTEVEGEATESTGDSVRVEDRDPTLFTQGLEFDDEGNLFHSGGRYGESRVVKTDPAGEVLAEYELPEEHFAEGLTLIGDEVYVLTWREKVVHVLDADDLSELRTLSLDTEGWGACQSDAGILWISDGTATVRGYNPTDMTERASFTVTGEQGEVLDQINELECIGGEIWANVWHSNSVLVLDPETGEILQEMNFSEFVPEGAEEEAVLNGIAFDKNTGEVWITGKLWEHFYVFDYDQLRDEA